MNRVFFLSLVYSFIAISGIAQDYEYAHFSYQGQTLPYRYLIPNGSIEQKLPLVVFLHGAGERGDDNEKQLTHGGKLFRDSLSKYPAMVIFPQCKQEGYWPNVIITKSESGRDFQFKPEITSLSPLNLVELLIDSLIKTGNIDLNRIYIGGLSMGAMGTYAIVGAHPTLFAAAIAICGGGDTELVDSYAKNTPFWIFHGAMDDVVREEYSIVMSEAITAAGGHPKLTIYPDANHNSWDPAFAEPLLLKWLYSHKNIIAKP